jgi:gamma-glutamylcyclotransferase (GGCT)/AIG2-like uncharacterized protein YtfP
MARRHDPLRLSLSISHPGEHPSLSISTLDFRRSLRHIRPMTDPYFFGYGSLVNRATHSYVDAHRATLSGWRRTWRVTSLYSQVLLTATPCAHSEIQGLIAAVPGHDWAALDARELGYDRHHASHQIRHDTGRDIAAQIYAVDPQKHESPAEVLPIYLSYLDVVVQGYLREFGEDGVVAFFETTDGWQMPVEDDRAAPLYPRAQLLSREERALTDRMLKRVA